MHEAHVNEGKKKEVQEIKELVKKYKVIGIVNMCNLPALQLQRIKQHLGDVILKFTKKRLIKIAFDELKDEKKNIVDLKDKLKGMPSLIFTNGDPFELAKLIKKNQSNAPAKAGQEAPMDLVVPAGPTDFAAGPMIGELGALGIKTKVENGKISILSDKVLVREGEVINAKQADLLSKLGVEPMKIGLNLLFTYENGEILSKDVLFIDEEMYIGNLKKASSEAVALALDIGYVVKDTAELLIAKAFREAKALEETAKVEDVKVEEKKEEAVKEEPKVEEKPIEEVREPVVEEKEEVVIEKEPEPVVEEPKVEEKPEEEKKEEIVVEVQDESKEEVIEEPEEIKETPLEKEIREQEEPQKEEAPKDEEDTVVVESKEDNYNKLANKAQEILDNVVTEKLAKQGSPIDNKKVNLRKAEKFDDVNKYINELKDKKSKGEL